MLTTKFCFITEENNEIKTHSFNFFLSKYLKYPVIIYPCKLTNNILTHKVAFFK